MKMENKTIGTSGIAAGNSIVPAKNTVTFNVSYPKDYKGARTMPEGPVEVAPDAAEHFASLGIGSIEGAEAKAKAIAPINATELIAQINEAETADAINALIAEGEERKTVLAAVEARKKAISEK